MGLLEGQVAFITGAARGQGRSHAVRLAREGASIVAIDIADQVPTVPYPMATRDDLAETVRLVEAEGGRILARAVDVRDLAALEQVVADGLGEFGRLDIVVANAGIMSQPARVIDLTEQAWQDMIDINLTGVWKTIRASVPSILAGGRGGSVVIVSSLGAMWANEHTAHYSAAKSGLVMLMKVLAKELGPERVRVNTIHPTTVATEMVLNDTVYRLFRPDVENPTRVDFEEAAVELNTLPVPALEPEDITATVVHLVADSGRYITGSTQVVDAGGSL